MNAVLYIHGKGGSAAESARFGPLFPGHDVIGLDYRTFTPWETGAEIRTAFEVREVQIIDGEVLIPE